MTTDNRTPAEIRYDAERNAAALAPFVRCLSEIDR